jgi:hypothetical protein
MNSFNKVKCVKCDIYFGSQERMGMCSVCFKDLKNKESFTGSMDDIKSRENSNLTNTTVESNITNQSQNIETKDNDVVMENTTSDNNINSDIRPIQTNKFACWTCNKKVGYLGFKCKCEYIFCGTHRHFSDHNCDFDYKTYDRQKLVKGSLTDTTNDSNKMIK